MSATKLAALVLAAGEGSRLGGGKMQLVWRHKPLPAYAMTLAEDAGCFDTFLCVVGHEADNVRRKIGRAGFQGNWQGAETASPAGLVPTDDGNARPYWHVLHNAQWGEGQSTSVLTGIRWLQRCQAREAVSGVMVFLGDQPLVRLETVQTLVADHLNASTKMTSIRPFASVPVHGGRRGNPVLLDAAFFPQLQNLHGDTGPRVLFQQAGERIQLVGVPDPGILFDVDTPEEYELLQNLARPMA